MTTYAPTSTFWCEPTSQVAVGLRRYTRTDGGCTAGPYHDAGVYLGTEAAHFVDTGYGRRIVDAKRPHLADSDPRWPTRCRCGYTFGDTDSRQICQHLIYRRSDTGDLVTLRSLFSISEDEGTPPAAPPGATWDAWWMGDDDGRQADGIYLMARLPNGHDWHIDGEAANCTRKGDRAHHCWVRHGDPRQANVTVDKAGDTCAAGAGSIASGDYHGFLRGGTFTAA